jgi:CRP-like cAMP-binding protein
VLTIVEAPSWVGEISVFDGLPRTHDLVAETDARVVHVPHEPLVQLLDREPRHWRQLAVLMTSKLRLSFTELEHVQLLPLDVRLARRLVWMADGYGEWSDGRRRDMQVSQDTLARMLSTSRQTINQLLKAFEARGCVKVSYGRVEIVDLAGLRRTARA